MRDPRRYFAAAVVPLICVLTVGPGPGGRDAPDPEATGTAQTRLLPTAEADGPATPTRYGDCGPDALPETGLQGQVPIGDQTSGRSARGYRCNLERIGRSDIGLRGQNFQLAWYEDCAYVSTVGLQAYTGAIRTPDPDLDGIAVLDASDPRRPRLTDVVRSDVAKSSHEGLEVNARRGLLVTLLGGLVAPYIEIYDVKDDCTKPRFLGRYDAGIPIFHGLRVSDDGNTVYATDTFAATGVGQMMHVVDITDPTRPTRLLTWDPLTEPRPNSYGSHDLDASADGDRLYLGTAGYGAFNGVIVAGPPSGGDSPSLAILDVSEVRERRRRPDIGVVSTLALPNFGHTVQRMRIGGRPHLLVSGEAPIGGPQKCPWAWGHIVDISDEKAPRRVSDLRLEVNAESACNRTGLDGGAIYSIHYVGVDDEDDTRYVFYTYYTGGLRVFDVRDPTRPVEVAYYNPPATPGTTFPSVPGGLTPDGASDVFDYTTSNVRFRRETGEIWVVSVNSGFQVLRLTGDPARQRATVALRARRAATAARTGRIPARVTCQRPCRGTVELRVGGRRSSRTEVLVPDRGRASVDLRVGAAARRLLRRAPGRRVSAVLVARDPLTGEVQQRVRTPRRALGR